MEKTTARFAAFSRRFTYYRQFINIKRSELARRAEVLYVDVAQFEAGKRLPTEEKTVRLAKVLGIQPSELVTAEDRQLVRPRSKERKVYVKKEPHERKKPGPKPRVKEVPQPALIKEEPKMQMQVPTTMAKEVVKAFKEASVPSTCRAVRLENNKVQVCLLPIKDGGVEGSGFCEDCYSPETVEKHYIYRDLLAEGYIAREAAAMAGLTDLF